VDDRRAASLRSIPVALGARAYDVVIGAGASRSLAAVLPPGVARAVVVCPEGLAVEVDPGVPSEHVVLPDGEGAKVLGTVETLCRRFAQAGLSRADAVVAVGGGVVSDLVGFAASVYLRGIAYVNVPTTLLAQVDAAIGGKTGVNLPEGKNLVGTFWQPAAVLCDTDLLATLPPREWSSGRGEMAKYAFLDAGSGSPPSPAALLGLPLDDQVAWCVAIKAAVVAADEREGDRRMVLNYGHTLAHALEADALASGRHDDLRHGEAVALGLVFAAQLARRLGRIDEGRVELHRRVVAAFDLPTDLPDASAAELVAYMARDKKARQDLTFVLDGPGGVAPVRGVDAADVVATLAEMGARP
jgi:5-deoxy-5-amino-3-dehydroquinate synthase